MFTYALEEYEAVQPVYISYPSKLFIRLMSLHRSFLPDRNGIYSK
jgi:hypothetical protein